MDQATIYSSPLETLSDLYGVPPQLVDIDPITIMGRWAGRSSVDTKQPKVYSLQIGFDHFFWGIGAFIQDPTDNIANFTRVEFNIFSSFEGRDLFEKPQNCGAYFTTLGRPDKINVLPGFKKFPNNTELTVQFLEAQLDGTWVGAVKSIGIVLYGAKINSTLMAIYEAEQEAKRAAAASGQG